MIIKRIDSFTVIVEKVMFSRSDSNGQYLSFSPDCTDSHIESLDNFLHDEFIGNDMPVHIEDLRGILVNLN